MRSRYTNESLRARLESACFRTGDLASGFSVRLPLFCRVDVRVRKGELDLVPRLGRARRSTSLWFTCLFSVGLPLALLFVLGMTSESAEHWQSDLPYFLFILWVGLMGMVAQVLQFMATEGAMIRITQIWSLGDDMPPKAEPSPRQEAAQV